MTVLEEKVVVDTDELSVAPALSAKADTLPAAAEEARIKYSVIGGSPVVYVFDDDMKFYLAYLKADMSLSSVFECTLMLPNSYTDGRIIAVDGGGGSGEYRIIAAAKVSGINVLLDYFFVSDMNLPQPEWVKIHSPSDSMLNMTVSELEHKYGKLTLEYSEQGSGQPVYSVEYMDGVYLVFHNWNMDDPLEPDMIPDELIVTDEVE